jgi:hypothetical protein
MKQGLHTHIVEGKSKMDKRYCEIVSKLRQQVALADAANVATSNNGEASFVNITLDDTMCHGKKLVHFVLHKSNG